MEYPKFIDRSQELSLLETLFSSKKPKLVLLYGRRRVGKTALLRQFADKHKCLYLLACQESERDQLKRLGTHIADFFQDKVVEMNPFTTWDALFTYINTKTTPSPIILDEFPYLVQSNKSLPSILQDYWDNYFSKRESFLILCGSSITMMESLLGYKNPLYGRRSESILLEPLKFFDAVLFFPNLSREQKVEYYSVLGGTPAYLLEFDESKTLAINIKEKILKKNSFLSQDVLFILREELNEPRYYFSLLHSISKGNTKLGQIINDTGLDKGLVIKYLSVLIELQLIERQIPITEKSPTKSRKGIYVLKDNFFKFWFRFIFENSQYIEQELFDKLVNEKITPALPSFIGYAFEGICLEWVRKTYTQYLVGKWWDRNNEIDIVGIDPATSTLLVAEVKWKDVADRDARTLMETLRVKASSITDSYEKIKYMIVAKSLPTKNRLRDEGILAYDLEDIIP